MAIAGSRYRRTVWAAWATVALTALGACGGRALAQCEFEWKPGNGPLGMDQSILAAVVYDDGSGPALYAGGSFTTAGGISANRIAKWDGTIWSPLGTGMGSSVRALAVYNGMLIAGGDFTSAGGVAANRIAQWDGSSWSPLGSGLDGSVRALTVHNGALIAGGSFTTAGGSSANFIAKWEGMSWSPLGSGMNSQVLALTVYDSALIAGGGFTTAGGNAAVFIAQWNDVSWSPLGSGMGGSVSALTVYDGALIAGGAFTTAGGANASRIARWDGSTWSALGGGAGGGSVQALSVYDGTLVAGGDFSSPGSRIAQWNGSSWTALGTGMSCTGGGCSSTVSVLTPYNGALVAGGSFTIAGGNTTNRIAQWSGSGWSALGIGGMSGGVRALSVQNLLLIAGGQFTNAGGVNVGGTAQFDGMRWSAMPGLAQQFGVPEVLALSGLNSEPWAGGAFLTSGGENIARWSGGGWSGFGLGTVNSVVHALTEYNGAMIAGGSFSTVGGVGANRIARWSGSWSALGSGMNNSVYALTVYNGALIAGGSFLTAGGVSANRVAQRNGTTWSALGSGVNGQVHALTVYNGALIAGGNFTVAGATPANSIARWNGTTWSPMGGGINGTIYGLTVYNGALVAGGAFTSAGGVSADRIAQWDGSSWSALGTGMDNTVYALNVYDGELVAGGDFTTAGGTASARWARWGSVNDDTTDTDSDGILDVCDLCPTAPNTVVVTHPLSQTACTGGSPVVFSVAASGAGLTYQWRKNGSNIADGPSGNGATYSGAATASLTIAGLASGDAGNYDVVVTGTCPPPVASETAVLTVKTPPAISTHPQPQTVCQLSTSTFTVSASGSNLTYQWRKNGANIADGPTGNGSTYGGTNSPMLRIFSTRAADAGTYHVQILGTCPPGQPSAAAVLTVQTAPAITTQPQSQTVCGTGSAISVNVTATGSVLTYQWRKDGSNIADGPTGNGSTYLGTTTPSLTITDRATADSGDYSVVVSGTCSPATTSSTAVLTINASPAITAQPQPQSVCMLGDPVTFTVTASGSGLAYQWRKNGANIANGPSGTGSTYSGATTAGLTITGTTSADFGDYDVVITGTCAPPATSNAAAFESPADADDDGLADACDTCTDTDGDGFGNPGFPANTCPLDGCPDDPAKTAPGKCGCGNPDLPECNPSCVTDADDDGTEDCHDGCPDDPAKIAPGVCGCGVADVDTDSDGTQDCIDGCPGDVNKIAPGTCGCGNPEFPECNPDCAGDADGDTTPDCHDGCPNDPAKIAPGVCGCGVIDVDTDSDGTHDCIDAARMIRPSPRQGSVAAGLLTRTPMAMATSTAPTTAHFFPTRIRPTATATESAMRAITVSRPSPHSRNRRPCAHSAAQSP